jgi:hypothetical protein
MLSLQGRIFYFACDYLWNAVSVFNYLMDDLHAPDIAKASTKWADAHSRVGNWLSEEKFFSIDAENIPSTQADDIYRLSETSGDTLINEWANVLWSITRDCHEIDTSIEETMWLYYGYCKWLSKAIDEFSNILTNQDMHQTVFYQHYNENATIFQELAQLLSNEQLPIALRSEAEAILETRVGQLAVSWREAVYAAANNGS